MVESRETSKLGKKYPPSVDKGEEAVTRTEDSTANRHSNKEGPLIHTLDTKKPRMIKKKKFKSIAFLYLAGGRVVYRTGGEVTSKILRAGHPGGSFS